MFKSARMINKLFEEKTNDYLKMIAEMKNNFYLLFSSSATRVMNLIMDFVTHFIGYLRCHILGLCEI